MKKEAFVYTWSVEDDVENEKFHIRMYGLDVEDRNICVHVRDFMPYFYIELSGATESQVMEYQKGIMAQIVKRISDYQHYEKVCEDGGGCSKCWRGKMEVVSSLKKLYFYHKKNSFAMIKVSFPNNITRKRVFYRLQGKMVQVGTNSSPSEIRIHENEANPVLQFCTQRHIDTTGWIRWDKDVNEPSIQPRKQTSCHREVTRHYSVIYPLEDKDKESPKPYVLSFDIEVYSSVPSRMPDPTVKEDVVFQISMVFSRDQKTFCQYLLSLGKPTISKQTKLILFNTEKELLKGFTRLICDENPNVIVGYNIFGFDMMYMIQRSKMWGVMDTFDQMGSRTRDAKGNIVHSPEKQITWSSSAYSHQNFLFLDTEGRLFVDLLPVVRRDYKFENYRLKTVSEFFIGETKDPVTPKDIFEGYRLSRENNDNQLLSRVGKYCVQDSRLVLLLFEKLQTWIGLSEMAKACRVPILTLYTQGQQIKVYSQLYYQCTHDKIIVQSPHSLGSQAKLLEGADHYSGAYVFPPKPGIYDWVIPFDFCSLYPSCIIAHNIDFSTLVTDPSVPDEKCHKIEWWDHIGCEHDTTVHAVKPKYVVCQQFSYRFLKEPRGVLPQLLTTLWGMRVSTRKQMKVLKDRMREEPDNKTTLETLYKVYDKRQLAYKVSMNSMYGAMGVKKGYLPFLPGAMCTTAVGRMSIAKAADYVKEHFDGQIVYGDSVAGYTPVRIRINGRFTIISIEELIKGRSWMKCAHDEDKESCELEGVETWTEKGWTRIERVIRHKLAEEKKMIRISTPTSIVDATDDHSMLLDNGDPVSPKDLHSGSALLLSSIRDLETTETMSVQEAGIMGFFFVNGTCGKTADQRCFWHIQQNSAKLMTHYQRLCRMVYPQYEWVIISTLGGEYKLVPRYGDTRTLVERYEMMATLQRIPDDILQGDIGIQESFWEGMTENRTKHFIIKSQVSAARVQFLASQVGTRTLICNTQGNEYKISISRFASSTNDHWVSSIVDAIRCDYVYDLTTVNHHFAAGIGDIIVHNTDSIYCHFPLPDRQDFEMQLWNHAKKIEDDLVQIFPDPMRLAFEEKLYKKFLILTKKRYMALTCDQSGSVQQKLTIRGVLLARRDNARWVRRIYEYVVRSVMAGTTLQELIDKINEELCELFRAIYNIPLKQFIVSKTLGKDYAVRPPPDDEAKRKKRLLDLGIDHSKPNWLDEYNLRSQPAHAQLAEKMKKRGTVVEPGSRIEYVVIQHPESSPKLFERLEDPTYMVQHSDLVRIDPLYYAQNMINPIDQLLEVCFKKKAVVETMIKSHSCFRMCMQELDWMYHPYYFEQEDGKMLPHPEMVRFVRKKKKAAAATKKKTVVAVAKQKTPLPDMVDIEFEIEKKKKQKEADAIATTTTKSTTDKKKTTKTKTEEKQTTVKRKRRSAVETVLEDVRDIIGDKQGTITQYLQKKKDSRTVPT